MSEISKKKQQLLQAGIDLGNPIGSEKNLPPSGRIQEYERGVIIYHPSFGACYLSVRVAGKWRAVASQLNLGYPTSDTRQTPQNDELCLFENGLIVCRPNGGDFAVCENVYRAYIGSMGAGMANFPGWIGYPLSDTNRLFNGWKGVFEHADIYQLDLQPGRIILGAIRERYNQLGAETGIIGLPVSDEHKLLKNDQEIGRATDFEHGTIYWSERGGAQALWGGFLDAYQNQQQGPEGTLGVPTSEELRSPGGKQYVNFQGGILVQNSPTNFQKIDHLQVTLTKLETNVDNDDLFVEAEVVVRQGGNVLKLEKRYGEFSDQGTKEIIEPEEAFLGRFFINDGSAVLTVNMRAWEIDSGLNGDDDFIAFLSKSYGIDTLWNTALPDMQGRTLADWYFTDTDNDGDPDEGKFRAFFHIDIDNFIVNPNDTSRFQQDLWWQVNNYTVDNLSKELYAATFADVEENDTPLWHQLLTGFYEDRYKKIGQIGVCFGICLEAIYALKGRSIFRQPISQYSGLNPSDPSRPDAARDREFQLRHGYQLSSEKVEYYSDLDDNVWNPVLAYNQSQAMFQSNDFPILAITNGRGAGHAVVPYAWAKNGDTLTITAANPNTNINPATITISESSNTFSFQFGTFPNNTPNIWTGGKGRNNGGVLFAMPYRIFSDTPHTPTATIGFDFTVLGAADGTPRRPVFAPLGLLGRANKAFFQVGGAASVRQVFDRAEGAYFDDPTNYRGYFPMERFMGLYPLDGKGVNHRPRAFVLTTSAERPLFFTDDLSDSIFPADKWHISHLAALIQSFRVMPNLTLDAISPLYDQAVIDAVAQENEIMRQRSKHETLEFVLENTGDNAPLHWYMASRHAQIRLETDAVQAANDLVIAEQIGEAGQLVSFQVGRVPVENDFANLQGIEKKLKASLLNPTSNRMWVLDEMKSRSLEPLSFQLNSGGNQVWIYNTNNDTQVDVQFWENDQHQPDVYLRNSPLPPNSITGFESVAPNSIKKEVYVLPGGDPISSVKYSNLHLDCRSLVHEWLVLSQGVTGINQVSTNAPSDKADSGGWFYCHDRVVDFCVEDGEYFITVQSGAMSLIQFTIREGVISYPNELEGIVSGSGTNTLVLQGVPVTVDAQAVQGKLVILPGVYGLSPDPIEHMSRPLVSGHFLPTSHDGQDGWFYVFNIDSGEVSTFAFQVCMDGLVRYDPQFEGMVQGQGTNVLTIFQFVAR